MKEKLTTHGLNPEKVIELLNLGKEEGDMNPGDIDQHKLQKISEKLNETIPIYYSAEQNPSGKLEYLRHTIAVLSGESIRELLQNPKTDIVLIRMIKNYGRKLSNSAESEDEHQISNTIYYAAIAHALVFHNLKISNHSYEKLKNAFYRLSEETWIPKNLINLFIKGAELSNNRIT